jgi:uncharacterized SAM-binding protein YcdF (DUF218 family)
MLSLALQRPYERIPMPRDTADAIVVLVGSFDPPSADRPYPLAGEDTYRRLRHGAWLFKYWSAKPILTCGGGGNRTAAEATRQVLESESIPASSIWLETHSRSTHENAVNCAAILKDRGISRIALVVNANSMLRAEASFKKCGLDVVPAPFQFEDLPAISFSTLLPRWKAIRLNGETLHEALGYLWYWLRGWV